MSAGVQPLGCERQAKAWTPTTGRAIATNSSSPTPDTCHLTPEHSRPALLEVPVSVGFNWSHFRRAQWIRELAAHRLVRPLRVVGILDRLNLIRQIKFSPEKANATRMQQLVDAYVRNSAPCVVMLLHSSSLLPGCSPYVPDQQRLDRLYQDLERTFEHCLCRHGMQSATLTGFAERPADLPPAQCSNDVSSTARISQ